MGIPCISSGPQWCIGGCLWPIGPLCLQDLNASIHLKLQDRIASLLSAARSKRRYSVILWPFHTFVLPSSMVIFTGVLSLPFRYVAGLLHYLHIYFLLSPCFCPSLTVVLIPAVFLLQMCLMSYVSVYTCICQSVKTHSKSQRNSADC